MQTQIFPLTRNLRLADPADRHWKRVWQFRSTFPNNRLKLHPTLIIM